MEKTATKDIFCREEIVGRSTITKAEGMRIVLAMDGVAEYHVLIVPVRHVARLSELTQEENAGMLKALRLVEGFYSAHGIDGYKLILLSGPGAGQTISHMHWHVIPGNSEFVTDPKQRSLHYTPEELSKKAAALAPEFK
ncbi:MAG: HIT family protein [Candidatus Marsarchaeota archaeon]|nr:HIT family protein [Candidatus Marsarchaeota archaeon]